MNVAELSKGPIMTGPVTLLMRNVVATPASGVAEICTLAPWIPPRSAPVGPLQKTSMTPVPWKEPSGCKVMTMSPADRSPTSFRTRGAGTPRADSQAVCVSPAADAEPYLPTEKLRNGPTSTCGAARKLPPTCKVASPNPLTPTD